jgi:hypothetical protein
MRWFNDRFHDVDTDDEEQDRIAADYHAHIGRVLPRLPHELARLASEPALHLHDARFELVEIDLKAATITIVVNAGDLLVGYRRITLSFSGAKVLPDDVQRLAYAVTATFGPTHWQSGRGVTEILDQEVDVLPSGRYSLALRLWPFHEFAIEFDDMRLTESDLDERPPAKRGSFAISGIT